MSILVPAAEKTTTGGTASNLSDSPGVMVFPPVLFLAAVVLGALLQYLWPRHLWNAIPARISGVALILIGVAFIVRAKKCMKKAGTNIRPDKPTTAIVNDGPYRLTRNPIYLGAMAAYVGLAMLLDVFWPLPALLPFAVVLHWGVVLREEKYLERKVGEAYVTYKASVRRWI